METRIYRPLTYGAQRRAEQVMIARGVLATQTLPHRETSCDQSSTEPDHAASHSARQAVLDLGPEVPCCRLRGHCA